VSLLSFRRRIASPAHDVEPRQWSALVWLLPALAMYVLFGIYPLIQTIRYSFWNWDGIGKPTSAGLSNYGKIFSQPELLSSIVHAFVLIIFFSVFPIIIGLIAATLMRELGAGAFSTTARAVLFIPQIVPLVGAGIAWTWMYSTNGVVNQALRAVGLGSLAQPWLGNFSTALPAVGLIGTWVNLGLCTLLLVSGIGKIDPSLYEAAKLDGAGRFRQLRSVTMPGLRREILVCVTVTVIVALNSFDVIFVSTQGGPGYQTLVPGLAIYNLSFLQQQVGLASALAVFLAVLVLAVILPLQRLGRLK
jgi:raffinose/stachyose/melibiose transport system permease protein